MDGPQLVKLLITASVLLLVFALGTRASFGDAASVLRALFQSPHRLARALVAMYVVVPAAAVCMGLTLGLPKAIRVALLAVAIAPIPPILPGKQLKLGGRAQQVFGLLVAVSLSAIVLVPVMVELLGRVFGRESSFGPWSTAALIGKTVLIPLAAGSLFRRLAPGWSSQAARWVSRLGTALLAISVVAVFVKAGPTIVSLTSIGAMLSLAALASIAIAAGHVLGGPDPIDRATSAFASAMRHPGIALAVATANVPEEPSLVAAILLYLVIALALTSVYAAVMRRRHAPAVT